MTATRSPAVPGAVAGPDVLSLPPPTTLRMILVAATLVVTALFVGTALHNTLLGASWDAAIRACLPPGTLVAETVEQLRCQAPAERRRALVAVGAVVVAVLLAATVVFGSPAVVRRRRKLKEPRAGYREAADALGGLAARAGVRTPGLLIVPGATAEALCTGRPGRYRIALPRKLALRADPALFDALAGHEMAHLRHRDVALSWLARSLGYVLGGLLALPVVVALVTGEALLALDVTWRSMVLLAVAFLVTRSLMRSREHDADLRAARLFDAGPVLDAELARRPAPTSAMRAALAWHPPAAQRRAVLADPPLATRIGPLHGLVLGFLAGAALPLVHDIVSVSLLGDPAAANVPALVSALTVGALVGAATGVELWRDALVARDGRRRATGMLAAGILVGAVLGQLTGLSGVALGVRAEFVVPLVLAGTTVLVGGLGQLWVAGVGRSRGPRAVWVPAVVLGATLTVAGLWSAPQIQLLLDAGGWPLLAPWLLTPGTLSGVALVAVVALFAGGWALRPGRDGATPTWWGPAQVARVHRGRGVLAVGVAAGVAGGLTGFVAPMVTGRPGDPAAGPVQLLDTAVLGAAGLAALIVLVLGLARGPAGAAEGLVAGPVAAALSVTVTALVLGAPSGVLPVVSTALAAGFLLSGVTALAASAGPLVRTPTAALVVAAALLGAVVTSGVTAARDVLVPETAPVPADLGPPVPRDLYFDVVARPLMEGRVNTASEFEALQAARPSNAEAVARIRSDVLPTLQRMRESARGIKLADPDVIEIHRHAIDACDLQIRGFEDVTRALETGDRELFGTGNALLTSGNEEWDLWAGGVLTL